MNRELLVASLKVYNTTDDEKLFIPRFLDLLRHPNAFQRDHLPGHITGSAWIIDSTRNFVLLTHHAKLNRWLQPGGHADGDENIVNVAFREALEETGLKDLKLLASEVFDVDIHAIPGRNDFPEHLHYDVRFLSGGQQGSSLAIDLRIPCPPMGFFRSTEINYRQKQINTKDGCQVPVITLN